MKSGDRIKWTYDHYLNRRASFRRTKLGEYFGLIQHTLKYKGVQLALVKFDGNKGYSKVNFYELKMAKK